MIKIKRKVWFSVIMWLALYFFIFNIINYFKGAEIAALMAAYELSAFILMFYVTTLFLFPRFYKDSWSYLAISLTAILVVSGLFFCIDTFIKPLINSLESDPDPDSGPPKIFHMIRWFMSVGFTYFVATSLSLMEQTNKLQELKKLLTEEKLETELKLLKAQINPHFIFNALNNIYSLTYMQSKNAPESVLKLSDMLRYVFYDCSKDRVPLPAELKYIGNFTAFQQMKSEFVQHIKLETELNGAHVEIAPMLFIPFVENAFKYSRIEEYESAYVKVGIKHQADKLSFHIENSIPENKPAPGSGMGIANVKSRLDIIYPDKYELMIEENKDIYRVDLNLKV